MRKVSQISRSYYYFLLIYFPVRLLQVLKWLTIEEGKKENQSQRQFLFFLVPIKNN